MTLIMQPWNHETKKPCPRCNTPLWWDGYWPCGQTMDCDKFICPECEHEFSEALGKRELDDNGLTKDDRFRAREKLDN